MNERIRQAVVIGDQSGLATDHSLRRPALISRSSARPRCRAARGWRHGTCCTLFPSAMELTAGLADAAYVEPLSGLDDIVACLVAYEERYRLPVRRPVCVLAVEATGDRLRVTSDAGTSSAGAVVSATGIWACPFIPAYPGRNSFGGIQLNCAAFRRVRARQRGLAGRHRTRVDAVIWSAGFRPALDHLAPLAIIGAGGVAPRQSRSVREPRLSLVGTASATPVGITRAAPTVTVADTAMLEENRSCAS